MRILWFTNHLLPEVAKAINDEPTVNEGWLVGMIKNLSDIDSKDEITVCCPKNGIKNIISGQQDQYKYVVYPLTKEKVCYDVNLHAVIEKILNKIRPDIVHIMGTEFPHSYSVIEACNTVGLIDHTVISIQGLVSVYERHYCEGLPMAVRFIGSLRDVLKRTSIEHERYLMKFRGTYEVLAIKSCKHIIGRTHWDKICTSIINPKREYHFNNEILRPSFYQGEWNLERCDKYTLFISQASYPIKGFHYALEALNIVLARYPHCKLYVAGSSMLKEKEFWPAWRRTSYENYLFKIIQKHNLREHIVFCGSLSEERMKERYLKSHIFISASTIENSPNSVGEAMILGVPTISSFVGGVDDLLINKEEGFLYQSTAPYMLAGYICELFENDALANKMAKKAREHALLTHDPQKNARDLLSIYEKINREAN